MTQQAISPLRQRMIEDMAIRKFAPKTQHDYVQRVKEFAGAARRFVFTNADTASASGMTSKKPVGAAYGDREDTLGEIVAHESR